MSEAAAQEVPPAEPPKKRELGLAAKMALLAVIERKKFTDRVGFKEIALKYGVSEGYLKQLWGDWNKGLVNLGPPQSQQEVRIEARVQHETTLDLLARYHQLILDSFRYEIIRAEDALASPKKKRLDPKTSALPKLSQELKKIMDLRTASEKGYDAVLSELAAEQRAAAEPRPVQGKEVSVSTEEKDPKVVSANDELRALQALDGKPAT